MWSFTNGATSQGIDVNLVKSADGTPMTGLLFNTAGLKLYYHYVGLGAPVQVTLATQTVGGAWASGGFVELDATNTPGLYRLDLPDAVLNFGIGKNVYIFFSGAGVRATPAMLLLKAFNEYTTGALVPAALVGGRMDSSAGALQPNVLTAAATAPDFATEIADGLLDEANGVEAGLTLRQWLRLGGSVLFGKASGLATNAPAYRDFADTKPRVSAVTDAFGNRTSVTRDAT